MAERKNVKHKFLRLWTEENLPLALDAIRSVGIDLEAKNGESHNHPPAHRPLYRGILQSGINV